MGLHPLHASHCRSAGSAAAPSLQKASRCSLGMAAASHLTGLLTLAPLVGPESPLLPPHVKRVAELILGSAGLGSLEREDFQKRVSESFLQDKHKETLVAALQTGFVGKAARTPLQNWVHLFHYLPTTLVKWLQEEECARIKTDRVMAFLCERGLHSPSEPTLAAVTVLVNYQNQSQLLQPCHSHDLFLKCKSWARAFLDLHNGKSMKVGPLQDLPSDPCLLEAPNAFFQTKPSQYSVFPADWLNFKALVACVPLRSNHGDLAASKRHKRLQSLLQKDKSAASTAPASVQLVPVQTLQVAEPLPTSPSEKPFLQQTLQLPEEPVLDEETRQLPDKPAVQETLQLPEKPVLQESLQLPEKPLLPAETRQLLEPALAQEDTNETVQPPQDFAAEAAAPKLLRKRSLLESVAELTELRKSKAAKKAKDPEELKEEAEAPPAKRRGRPPAGPLRTVSQKPATVDVGLDDKGKQAKDEQGEEAEQQKEKKQKQGKAASQPKKKQQQTDKKGEKAEKKQQTDKKGEKAEKKQQTDKEGEKAEKKQHQDKNGEKAAKKEKRQNTSREDREKFLKTLPPKVLKAFAKGCSKCRWRPYCTVCCWKHRGY